MAQLQPDRREVLMPTWHNHTGNQECHPYAISWLVPDELVEIVKRAERKHRTVHAVGAGHAWSDVALTDGYLLEPAHLGGPLLALDDGCLKPGAPRDRLARVLAGTHLRDLNRALAVQGLALPNMGGYDGQTIAGVVSTSTHGSGIRFGPFPDLVRSLDMVICGGELVRVEPEDGPTDEQSFNARYGGRMRLIRSNERFWSAVCGMGTMGLIHSMVIAVRGAFLLQEVRTLSTWEDVRPALLDGSALEGSEHYELFLNPYPDRHEHHRLLVTRRDPYRGDPDALTQEGRSRHPLTEAESRFPGTWWIVRTLSRRWPWLMTKGFNSLLRGMRDPSYVSDSYRVFNIGEANKIPAYSSELAVPIEGDKHVRAVDRILEIARADRRYHTSPIALRFVRESKAYASMMYSRPTMMIELIMAKDTRNGFGLLDRYEQELAAFDARPHWGQYNRLGANTDLQALYPRWPEWLETYAEFNASGVFNSAFTDRIGISV
jgi:hypothetical protein